MTDRRWSVLLAFVVACLLCLSSTGSAQESPWPLVRVADSLMRGTIVGVDDGVRDRQLWVDTSAGSAVHPIVAIVEPAGMLSEGSALTPGGSGIFLLVDEAIEATSEFPSAAGSMLAGGYLPLVASDAEFEAIETLRDRARSSKERFGALSLLLSSKQVQLQLLALGALTERQESTDATLRGAITARLLGADDGRVASAVLNLTLTRGWPLEEIDLCELLLGTDSPAVSHLTLEMIGRHGGAVERANLLVAWPDADPRARLRLIDAYRHLTLTESLPFWTEALVSDDPRLVAAAISGLGEARIPGAEEKYRLLLDSPRKELQALALRGLARTATRGSFDLLREFENRLASSSADLSLKKLSSDLLRDPWRVLGGSPEPSEGGGW